MLYGDRVRLRAVERDDIPTFVRWLNDPEVRQFLLLHEPLSMAMEEQWFERQLASRDGQVLAIEAKLGDDWMHIGNAGLHRIDSKNRTASFGIFLGEKDYWGRGFGSDAARTMLAYAFDELGLHRVELLVYDFNPRARRCYEKVGFRLEGTRRDALFRSGRFHDIHCLAVLEDEFRAARSPAEASRAGASA